MGDERTSFFEDDEIMRELRAYRRAYSAKFNGDIDAIAEDLRRKQKERGIETVTLPPRLLKDTRKAE